MGLKFGVCSSWENSAILKNAGADFIELPLARIAQMEEKDFDELSRNLTLPAEVFNILLPSNLKIVGEAVDWQTLEHYLKLALPRAKRIGGEVIVFGSGGARRTPDNWDKRKAKSQLLAFLNLAIDIAEKEGLKIAIEPLNRFETNTINRLEDALELVEELGKNNLGVLADFYHILKENEHFDVLKKAKDKLLHIHISDEDRNPPLERNTKIEEFFCILKKISYKGRISIESQWENLEKELPLAIENLKREWRCS
ncbi:sugar phosphate isomerase/epimerase [bacterium]|nr:sugar phosphate isomerase/epimerase [bacterium]